MDAARSREIRRHAGALAVGLGQLGLGEVCDPRSKRSRRWQLPYLLTALLCGPAVRRRLHIFRRVPDTTLRASLVSARAAVCIDAKPMTAEQSEGSAFPEFIDELLGEYSPHDLFRLVSCDADFTSEDNARYVKTSGLGYLFALEDNQPTLYDEAHRYLGRRSDAVAEATTTDRIDNRTEEVRATSRAAVNARPSCRGPTSSTGSALRWSRRPTSTHVG